MSLDVVSALRKAGPRGIECLGRRHAPANHVELNFVSGLDAPEGPRRHRRRAILVPIPDKRGSVASGPRQCGHFFSGRKADENGKGRVLIALESPSYLALWPPDKDVCLTSRSATCGRRPGAMHVDRRQTLELRTALGAEDFVGVACGSSTWAQTSLLCVDTASAVIRRMRESEFGHFARSQRD
jgi:hypothetical protein